MPQMSNPYLKELYKGFKQCQPIRITSKRDIWNRQHDKPTKVQRTQIALEILGCQFLQILSDSILLPPNLL